MKASGHPDDVRAVSRCVIQQARFAVDAGIDIVQLREPHLNAADLAALTRAVLDLARGTATRVIVNDRFDVAIACAADGVHLRHDSPPAEIVRRHAPGGFLIGRSVHDAASARAAGGAIDYLTAGSVWPTGSKPPDHPTLGLHGLQAIVEAVPVPVIAIGGVTVERISMARAAGAAGIAAIGLFLKPAAPPQDESPDGGCRAMPLSALVAAIRAAS